MDPTPSATSFAFTAATSAGQPFVGAVVFPAGLVITVLLGLELITGSLGLLSGAPISKKLILVDYRSKLGLGVYRQSRLNMMLDHVGSGIPPRTLLNA